MTLRYASGVRSFPCLFVLVLAPLLGCTTGLDGKSFDGAGASSSSSSASSTSGSGGSGGETGTSTTTTTSSSGEGGGGGAGGGIECSLDDELDDLATLTGCWTNRAVVEGGADGFTYSIDATGSGHLIARPDIGAGFWETDPGPYLYKLIEGDFVVVTYVSAHMFLNEGLAPTVDYNLAGIVVRAPISGGFENWVKYETGRVDSLTAGVGSLMAGTINSASAHVMPYSNDGIYRRRLAVCRVGNSIHFISNPNEHGTWDLANDLEHTSIGGAEVPSLPPSVQVGITVSGYAGAVPPDVEASFDYVRFSVMSMSSVNDCIDRLNAIAP